ncbi:alpha/beta fold hydrolase [Phytomonospora endophytica]|uniref:Pimeloyl-ACP methyl ester carboxylesterase n=1 Tax=Phytomonospora endophytica TaxID=714109 RepID=A0A841FRZ2_9ACTN|nr:alpha/beta hydrolase [Phytomonospora endophytica]MBB6036077.1 pimeloyl-ACP methyl ester carboxylesterase [Phytomonospora endophytica]GIG66982.1 hydrolase [Phytomonospora endophytica]
MPTFTAPDGTALAYRTVGDGPPLLCVPGGPMRASAYLGDLGGLSRHRTLILFDLRGTGDSAIPADPASYRADRQVGDVEALREHLGLDRVDVLAHSAGGDLALLYATAHPERVANLVMVTARARALGVDFTAEQRREVFGLRAGEKWFPEAHEAFLRLLDGTGTDDDFATGTPFFYGRWDDAAKAHSALDDEQSNADAGAVYARPEAFDPVAALAVAGKWDTRVLVLAGELDGAPRPHVAAAIAGLFPDAECTVLAGAGHFPWLDDADGFTAAVEGFLG